ncbi:MAG: hypothetical protein CVU46_06495 [Chloroflexi bacterium HGW-Chloroflexi-8]|nr:MAG: hypothetical protein CVU46_06495 [Chloroflexi bacterium HGW-Chloroflexi-8]
MAKIRNQICLLGLLIMDLIKMVRSIQFGTKNLQTPNSKHLFLILKKIGIPVKWSPIFKSQMFFVKFLRFKL